MDGILQQRLFLGRRGFSGRALGRRKLGRSSLVSFGCDTLPLLDVASFLLGGYAASALCGLQWATAADPDFWNSPESRAIVWAILAPFLLNDPAFSSTVSNGSWSRLFGRHALRFVKLVALILIVSFAGGLTGGMALRWCVTTLAFAGVATLVCRAILVAHMRLLERGGVLAESIAVVGAGPFADRFVEHLRSIGVHKVDVVGVFDDRRTRVDADASKPTGTIADLLRLGQTRSIDCVVVALPTAPESRLLAIVRSLEPLAVPVALCPANARFDALHHQVDTICDALPVELLADRPIHRWDAVFKSAMDFALAAFAVIALSPVLMGIAAAVRISGPGPILFRQRRHGWNNGEFYIYKFRSMRWEGDGSASALKQTTRGGDSRITPVGAFLRKSSLDELPQLLNVLRGEMSLVGPRPHATNMRTEERLGHEIIDAYAHRHRVKPGITGWAQVNGSRGATDTTEQLRRRVELDLHYIENWSLWLDVKILFKTVASVLKATNAF
jgi:Undecaprenyl-phosphate glucose phosphotransferase